MFNFSTNFRFFALQFSLKIELETGEKARVLNVTSVNPSADAATVYRNLVKQERDRGAVGGSHGKLCDLPNVTDSKL